MLTLGGEKVLIGGFHDHWSRNGSENPTLLLAAMNYYHYDFICLMDGGPLNVWGRRVARAYCPGVRIYLGQEVFYPWGHVITVEGRPPDWRTGDGDFRSVLADLKRHCAFVALAHPGDWIRRELAGETQDLARLLADGLLDAVEPYLSEEELRWVAARTAAGLRTPVVGGWDSHLLIPLRDLPPVLYGRQRPPIGHLDSCAGNRHTLVFADANALPAIIEAVRAGRSVVEDEASGQYLGPPALVRFLLDHGYRETLRDLDARRDRVTLSVPGPLTGGDPVTLAFSEPGEVRLPGTLEHPLTLATDDRGRLTTPPIVPVLDRDVTHVPVAHVGRDGYARTFAVEMRHPIQLEAYPRLDGKGAAVEIVPRVPFQGRLRLTVETLRPGGHELGAAERVVPLPSVALPPYPVAYRLDAQDAGGQRRTVAGLLTFVAVPRFPGGWDDVPALPVDRPAFTPEVESAWGANRPWPGADVFAAWIQLAWTAESFLCRTRVRDAVHHQPHTNGWYFEGDSVQIGLDPYLRRADTYGDIAAYLYAHTPAGPRVVRWMVPDAGLVPGFQPPPANVDLGEQSGRFLTVEPWSGGLIYTLRLPWREMYPASPPSGTRLGLFLMFNNSDGGGMLDALHWPAPIPGMHLVPRRWGIVTLAE